MKPSIQSQLALVSVSDKSGIVEFLAPLVSKGWRVISTGGTSRHLREHKIPVIEIEQYTGFPEVMDGRVRTLHPAVHMALLARQDEAEDLRLLQEHKLEPIDLVVVNLYPFEKALSQNLSEKDLIEQIDIGGPTLLRAASKNFERVTVVCDPKDYTTVQKALLSASGAPASEESDAQKLRRYLAGKVFSHTAAYDAMISRRFLNEDREHFVLGGKRVQDLRYGENAQQKAVWYREPGVSNGLHHAEILQGKELSFNNLLDLHAALTTVNEFQRPAAVAVKHNNPCGVACADQLHSALLKALKADPVSVFGGIVAVNRELRADDAQALSELFLECVIVPAISTDARDVLAKKKNLRVLLWPEMCSYRGDVDVKTIAGGFLTQELDRVGEWNEAWKIDGGQLTEAVRRDLIFAWKVCAHLKSNAIALACNEQTLGLGMGQVNRVDAVQQSIQRMRDHHPKLENVVLASDAFFPFPDSVEIAAKSGIRFIIQPGGSLRDAEVLARAKELGITTVLTGTRHFRH